MRSEKDCLSCGKCVSFGHLAFQHNRVRRLQVIRSMFGSQGELPGPYYLPLERERDRDRELLDMSQVQSKPVG